MAEPVPIVLIPGLLASPRLFAAQIPELWRFGPVTVADHTRDDSMTGIARRILAASPPRFALAGLSMGGYIAFEILRQAPERVARLALLDTSARADVPQQTEARVARMALARSGRFAEIADQLFPVLIHPTRQGDQELRRAARLMADDVGPEGLVNQETANMNRPDSRASAAAIRCPTLVLVGDGDMVTPPERAEEMAAIIPGAVLVSVPECGHLATIERPDQVNRALADWLGGHPR